MFLYLFRESIKEDEQNTWDQHLLMELEKLEKTKLSVHTSGGYFKGKMLLFLYLFHNIYVTFLLYHILFFPP